MNLMEINISAFRAINDLGKQFAFLDPVFFFFAEYTVYLLALAVVIYWFTRKNENRIMIISAALSLLIAEILAKLAGFVHANNQPFAELSAVHQLVDKAIDNSFPSDHTILFFTFCLTFWLFGKKHRLIWMILAVCVALSRIGVGVHYPADVLVGAIFGTLSALLSYAIVPKAPLIQRLLALYERIELAVLPRKDKERSL
ncbi:undecaprenyl-diphosphatase [Brevibacillus invocatus]|uniref:Undecaprenyl-diphosphatase n=1 Tax=Brevibacillus invocatus TaxID=173959 RepID=A0A3M8C805_9BACL|nr:undecaprenyl-diphosphatase [Brevibacillus invocatus]MCM3081848.1 undecaprenyl-diphosphatase [Brevibacillus invocatus]MCM3432255.1 undecaprenyl-diphosphatase [Brevibacillus invocatus]RNB71517.1 undecaprenyl-diphosphatase [Brevibacillus invocatus]